MTLTFQLKLAYKWNDYKKKLLLNRFILWETKMGGLYTKICGLSPPSLPLHPLSSSGTLKENLVFNWNIMSKATNLVFWKKENGKMESLIALHTCTILFVLYGNSFRPNSNSNNNTMCTYLPIELTQQKMLYGYPTMQSSFYWDRAKAKVNGVQAVFVRYERVLRNMYKGLSDSTLCYVIVNSWRNFQFQ